MSVPRHIRRSTRGRMGARFGVSCGLLFCAGALLGITECSATDSQCDYESVCNVGSAWQRINVAIRRALEDVSLVDLLRANSPVPTFHFGGLPVSVQGTAHKKN